MPRMIDAIRATLSCSSSEAWPPLMVLTYTAKDQPAAEAAVSYTLGE